ncbi:MAG: hypothetical protein IPG92_13995 [Flavobacteriales bacterium]|nr:hypothetical protein [Flavobacteriales bacterium]
MDGITAQEKRVNTEWLGWRESVTITVDLGSEQDINYMGIGSLNETYSWIHRRAQSEIPREQRWEELHSHGTNGRRRKPGERWPLAWRRSQSTPVQRGEDPGNIPRSFRSGRTSVVVPG